MLYIGALTEEIKMFYGMAAGKNKPVPEPPNMMNQG
jgi:hypothetical protein